MEQTNSYYSLLSYGHKILREFKEHIAKCKEEEDFDPEHGNYLSGPTGLEYPTLDDNYFQDICNINNFIFTVASTNYPSDPTFQNMFIEGIGTKEIVFKLVKLLPKSYYYLVKDMDTNEILKHHLPPLGPDLILAEESVINCPAYTELPSFVGKTLRKKLCNIIIEDSIMERRTLYKKLFSYLNN